MINKKKIYKELISSEESLSVLDQCIELFEVVAGYFFTFEENALELEVMQDESIIEKERWLRFSQFDTEFSNEELESLEGRKLRKQEKIALQTRIFQVFALLSQDDKIIREHCKEEGAYSFAHDVLLLVFHNAYFCLLPELKVSDWKNERMMLLHSFFRFSELTPNIADKFRVKGLAFFSVSENEEALSCFRLALNFTHVDEHDYITRLQTLWMYLLEENLFQEALRLLVDEHKRVQRQDIDEVGEMIVQTFIEYQKSEGK